MNVILFTDLSDSPMFIRVQGAYSIASHLRNNGYTVKVIDNQAWLWENHGKKLTEYVEGLIDSDTIFVGFSSTFSRYFDTGFQGSDDQSYTFNAPSCQGYSWWSRVTDI
jgi:membrane protease subunit (stomatin/prohibitin family)